VPKYHNAHQYALDYGKPVGTKAVCAHPYLAQERKGYVASDDAGGMFSGGKIKLQMIAKE